MGCIITYQKGNGEILIRPRNSKYDLYIGKETSMGWKVLDIHYEYDGNYYHEADYYKQLEKTKKTMKQRFAEYIMHKASSWR